MSDLEQIIKQNFINSYTKNAQFEKNLKTTFNSYYIQNIKYHILWLFLHSFSFAYPLEPSEEYKIETTNFIYNIIPKNIGGGCGSCQNDYKKFIEDINIFRVVSTRDTISKFFIDLHNHINSKKYEESNKYVTNNNCNININQHIKSITDSIYNYDDIKQIYTDTDYISLLESKYNINMFKLIEQKALNTFYTEFNKINIQTIDIQFDIAFQIT